MSIRSILVPLDGASDNRAVLENALKMARPFGAHVEVLHVRADARDSIPLFGEGLSGDMVEEMITNADRDATEKATALKAVFEAVCAQQNVPQVQNGNGAEGVSARWCEHVGREDDVVSWQGRLSDLVVCARPVADSSPMRTLTLNAALFESARPVLALPNSLQAQDIGRVVVIAWNGTAQAARAVQGAMAFITRAAEVHVMTCESTVTDGPSPGEELAAYLNRWGVSAQVTRFAPGPNGIGETLLEHAGSVHADLFVCGAYSHSRFVQTVLGGVTSALMDTATIPVLFGH
jgi:nucleotide-binding universal stress UspA family protein